MRLEICCQDRVGIVQEVLNILVRHEISLTKIEVLPNSQRMYVAFPEVQFEQLQQVMPQIRKIHGIGDVKTIAFIPSEREHHELKTLLKALPDGIISLDPQGRVLWANHSALTSINCVASEVIGHPIGQFLTGFDISRWLASYEAHIVAHTVSVIANNEEYVADVLPVRMEGDSIEKQLLGAVINLKSESRLGLQVGVLKRQDDVSFSGFIGKSANMKKLIKDAQKMGNLDEPMLLTGETGTGKETLARACHEMSRGAAAPFIAINCASIPDADIEGELFGRGSAERNQLGLLEQANGGTLFLDEVGDMSSSLQGKIVRFLQNGVYRRVGCEQEVRVDVRVICSTQQNLFDKVEKGLFRQDLFYRLNVLTITLPPLRERKQDIMLLVMHFLQKCARKMGTIVPEVDEVLEEQLTEYHWPGNIRQLENALFRAVTLLEGDRIRFQHLQLPTQQRQRVVTEEFTGSLDEAVKQYEGDILRQLFPSYPSSRQLAKRLGLSHTAVANKLREHGIGKKVSKT